MKLPIPHAMSQVLRMTRSGHLKEATAVIRAALLGTPATDDPSSDAPFGTAEVLPGPTSPPDNQRSAFASAGLATQARPGIAGSFDERSFQGSAGHLGYRLYIPAGAHPGMPLVVMLHGCTQTPEDFARGTQMNRLADERGFLVAYPRQTRAANAQKCWNWFKPDDQHRDRGEPALIAGATRQIIADEQADPARVYVAGLSAGGAAAAIMADAYPDLFAAAGIHSGLACGAARDLPSAMMAMKNGARRTARPKSGRFVPVITFHGDRDMTVHQVNSRQITEQAAGAVGAPLHTETETGTQGGRKYTRTVTSGADGHILIEEWTIHGAGHSWSGGDKSGSFVDPAGPDASEEMLRFFLIQRSAR